MEGMGSQGYVKPYADQQYYPPPYTDPIRGNFRYDPFSGVSTTSVRAAGPSHSLLGLLALAGIVLAFEWARKR
jgi:hypothetical protein